MSYEETRARASELAAQAPPLSQRQIEQAARILLSAQQQTPSPGGTPVQQEVE